MRTDVPSLLTIAGTDPSGGAGIQVDLQVFRDFGFHGASAVTAVVSQNTCEVRGFESTGPDRLRSQLVAVGDDLSLAGVKIGMLPTVEAVEVTGRWLSERVQGGPVVFDPVMASGTGEARLNRDGTTEAMVESLLPHVDLLTPNVPEAEVLVGRSIDAREGMRQAAGALRRAGPRAVLLKAGHLETPSGGGSDPEVVRDLLADREGIVDLEPLPAVEVDVRGTGCQLSSALAAVAAGGADSRVAAERARGYLNRAIRESRARVGRGRPIVVRAGSDRFSPEGD